MRSVTLRCPRGDGKRACNRPIGEALIRDDGVIQTIWSGSKGGPAAVEPASRWLPPDHEGSAIDALYCERHGLIPLDAVHWRDPR